MRNANFDPDFLRLVLSRIKRVREGCKPGTSEDALLGISNDLRALIDHNELQSAWHQLRPSENAFLIRAIRLKIDEDVTFAFVGGAKDTASEEILEITMKEYSSNDEAMEQLPKLISLLGKEVESTPFLIGQTINDTWVIGSPGGMDYFVAAPNPDKYFDIILHHDFRFNEFKESCAIYAEFKKITRQQVIQYISNTQGGSHWDPEFKGAKPKARENFEILSYLGKSQSIQQRNSIFFAFMSIAQSIVDADDTKRLETAIEEAVAGLPRRR